MKVQVLAMVASAATAAGCSMTPVDEETRYARADERLRAAEHYELLKQSCRESGGILFTEQGGGRFQPSRADVRMMRCTVPMQRGRP